MPPHRTQWAIKWTWLCPPGTAATSWARLGRAGHRAYQEAASPHQTTEILLCPSVLLEFGALCRQEQPVTHSWHGMEAGEGQCHSPKGTCTPGLCVEVRLGGLQAAPSLGVPSTGTGAELPRWSEALPARSDGHQQGWGLFQPCPGPDGS